MGMQDCNPSRTPMSNPLFAHAKSDDHNGSFNYRSAIGMMMYLVNNVHMGSPIYSHFDNPVQDYSPNKKSRQTKVRSRSSYILVYTFSHRIRNDTVFANEKAWVVV
eukprot:scaffold9921_cov99-Amphora_coffeaeformis.AAC.1